MLKHNQTELDRTYTVMVRKQYSAEMNKRFRKLKGLIRKTVQKFDAFNIRQNVEAKRNFPFTEDSEKVDAFMDWLKQAQNDEVLEIFEYDNGRIARRNAWQNKYIQRSYKKGVKFADKELRKRGVKIPYDTTERDLETLFNKPIHADKVGMLYTRNFNELKGITDAMDQQISRELANGMAQGWNPRKIASKMNARVDKIGITRARTLARTEVIRAHADATLARYEQYGVKKVEWIFGGGPCPTHICEEHANHEPWKLGNNPAPPAHPNCYHKDTDVLTNQGWKKFYNLTGNEKIFSMNPENREIDWLPYNEVVSYKYDGDLIRLHNRSYDIAVTPDHNQLFGSRNSKDRSKLTWKTEPVEDLIERYEFALPRTGIWQGKDKDTLTINSIEFETEDLMKFMGFYLSEGSITERDTGRLQVQISQNPDGLDYIANELSSLPLKMWQAETELYFPNQDFARSLVQYGKSDEKFVPGWLKALDSKYLLVFLNAFLYGDGSERETTKLKGQKKPSKERELFTSSDRLASDLGELIFKIGDYPSYYLQRNKGKPVGHTNGKYTGNVNVWRIRWNVSENARYYKSKESGIKVEQIPYDDMVYDVSLPKWHVLAVRRNGKTAWSGNCTCTLAPIVAEGGAQPKFTRRRR